MRRLRKKFDVPKQPWDRDRIDSEREILSEYGLKNKEELWKAETKVRSFMRQVKSLVASHTDQSEKEKKQLLDKLVRVGLIAPSSSVEDVLGIDLKQLLDRRLQTVVFKKGLAQSVKQARQIIVHGHVTVAGSKITIPSYIISVNEESSVNLVPGSFFVKQHEELKKKKEEKKSKEENLKKEEKSKEKPKKDVVKDGEKSKDSKPKAKGTKSKATKPAKDTKSASKDTKSSESK
tara:strand:- start:1535 stop:2236 length:702 start_codon:yes stop_codon:yes gene_type:complete